MATTGGGTSIGARMALAATMAIIGLAGATCAKADPVDLRVVDRDTGEVLPVWRHQGRDFVAGRPGARYSLRVSNHTDDRVLVVLSVDGVNIISGETAGFDQRGYIFAPYQSYDLTGWRKSNTEVAAFTFAPLPQSYAARTGRPADVGVIGLAMFRERAAPPPAPVLDTDPVVVERLAAPPPPPPPPPAPAAAPSARAMIVAPPPLPIPPVPRSTPRPASAAADVQEVITAQRRDEKLGTAHGAREWSVSNVVPFERATPYPQFTRQIEYDTYANLVAAGVIRPVPPPQPHPRPFPADPGGAGYVPDPPDDR